jgi:nucleolar protein 16
MGRELQKRKNRSSRAVVRQPVRRRKALNPSGNALIAVNWNKKETLSQNYRRLGLVAKLGHASGGVEPEAEKTASVGISAKGKNPFAVKTLAERVYSEVRVERDPETGKIVRVLGGKGRRENPLGDLLSRFDEDSEDEGREEEEWGGIEEEEVDEESRPAVIRQLERDANAPREKVVRHQSEREVEWLKRLVDKHGDDVGAMARDLKANPMQQSAADIRRRLRKAGLLA